MKSNSTFGLARLFTAFAAAIMLLAVPSCEKAQPEEGEQPLPPITPLPQPELPEEVEDNYDETKILSHVKEFSFFDNLEALPHEETKFERGAKVTKFASDADYIYGYVEVNTADRDKWQERTNILNNLGVWIDKDDKREGQGGGWFLCNYKGFELLLRGKCATAYEPTVWNPQASDVSKGGDNFGNTISSMEEWTNIGTGKGDFTDGIFRYTFTIDRTRLELKGLEEIGIGVTFDEGGMNDYAIIPDRSGFRIKLNN